MMKRSKKYKQKKTATESNQFTAVHCLATRGNVTSEKSMDHKQPKIYKLHREMAADSRTNPFSAASSSHYGSSSSSSRTQVVMYSAHSLERTAMEETISEVGLGNQIKLTYVTARLDEVTAELSANAKAVILFTGDSIHKKSILKKLRDNGVKLIVLRYAGRAAVDEKTANEFGIQLKQVISTTRSSNAVAEYVISLILALQKQMVVMAARSKCANLNSPNSNIHPVLSNRTIGVIGTDKVGCHVIRILRKIGCKVLAFDVIESNQVREVGAKYVAFERLLEQSDVITFHIPNAPKVKHIINDVELGRCKPGVHIVNTSYLHLVNLDALLRGLENGRVGGFAADLFDGITAPLFRPDEFHNQATRSASNFHLTKLKQRQNVIITAHQSTMTLSAQKEIAADVANILAQIYGSDVSGPQGSAGTSTS